MAGGGKDPITSLLATGPYVDLNATNLTDAAGETMDLLACGRQIMEAGTNVCTKTLYMLTMRIQQQKKDHRSTRVKYGGTKNEGGDETAYLWVSFPTGESSMKAGELTPGRFRTLVADVPSYLQVFQHKGVCTPVVKVVGFEQVLAAWDRITDEISSTIDKNHKQAAARHEADLEKHKTALENYLSVVNTANDACSRSYFENKIALDFLRVAPDRMPPSLACDFLMFEIGATFAQLQDVRNTVIASIQAGTAAAKAKTKSNFYTSFVRRTQAGGPHLQPELFEVVWKIISEVAVEGMMITSDLPEAVRAHAQDMVDWLVRKMSNNVPEKL